MLDPMTRRLRLPTNQNVLLTDTVGFIRKLPHSLVEAFKATLEEVVQADLLVHVVDVSHPAFHEQIEVVNDTLSELEAAGKPTIFVFNKIDKVTDRSIAAGLAETYRPSVFISAQRGINISTLEASLLELLNKETSEQTILVKQSDYRTIAKLHEWAEVLGKEYENNSVKVRFRVSGRNSELVRRLLAQKKPRIVP